MIAMASTGYFSFLLDGANWSLGDPAGFPHRILQHVEYSAVAMVIATVIALPVGLLIGHTNRGVFLAISVGNAGRALPSLGLVVLMVLLVGLGLLPVMIALVALAIPPILTTTYAGIRAVSRSTVDAARGIGMTEWRIVRSVEIPNALPLIFGGLRNATLQVISTATLVAYLGEGGLGRFLFDGLGQQDYPKVVGGCVVLAVLAVIVDQAIGVVQRAVVSPGVDGRALTGRTTQAAPALRGKQALPTSAS